MPLLGRFGFVKRALARNRIATVVTHVDSAMVVAGLRPEATGALILVGAHSDHLLDTHGDLGNGHRIGIDLEGDARLAESDDH